VLEVNAVSTVFGSYYKSEVTLKKTALEAFTVFIE
jgi:hypothetical protein